MSATNGPSRGSLKLNLSLLISTRKSWGAMTEKKIVAYLMGDQLIECAHHGEGPSCGWQIFPHGYVYRKELT